MARRAQGRSKSARRLAAALKHAGERVPFYDGLIPAAAQFRDDPLACLARLPRLSRRELGRRSRELRSRSGDDGSWRAARSSGTTGEPVELWLDAAARAAERDILGKHLDRVLGGGSWRKSDLMHLTLHAGAATRSVPSPWDPGARAVKWNLLRAWQGGDEELSARLAALRGHVVTALPSTAELLAGRLERARSRPEPRIVVLSGEESEPEFRERVARAFGAPVTAAYTMAEAGIAATACPDGGYHAEEDWSVLEIARPGGGAAAEGRVGELLVTPLANRATVLLRYRTGDRGRWLSAPCRCSRRGRRFELLCGRRVRRLAAASGAGVSVVRFAKLFCAIGLERYAIRQEKSGCVKVAYEAARPLAPESIALVSAAFRGALGPGLELRVVRGLGAAGDRPPAVKDRPVKARPAAAPAPEPEGPSPEEIAAWLRPRLAGVPGLRAAVLTGSALDAGWRTRFSDLDLALLWDDPDQTPPLCEREALALSWRRAVPALSAHFDALAGLSKRAALLSCRLLSEQLPVLGRLDASALPWPSREDIAAEGRFWAHGTRALLWLRLVEGAPGAELLREAALAAKLGWDALRYLYLAAGLRDTAARRVAERAAGDGGLGAWKEDLFEASEVARELRPPPVEASGARERYLRAALAAVEAAARSLA